jgi:hypothetical protein
MPGTPGARTGLATILTGDAATAFRTTINASSPGSRQRDAHQRRAAQRRPTSTPGSPGIPGRKYYATDLGLEFRDTGTGWVAYRRRARHRAARAPYNGQGRLPRRRDQRTSSPSESARTTVDATQQQTIADPAFETALRAKAKEIIDTMGALEAQASPVRFTSRTSPSSSRGATTTRASRSPTAPTSGASRSRG